MRIRGFTRNIEFELKAHQLKNCRVVIDGQNYFYNLYQDFNLPFQFGCEADKYAECLRKHLMPFKRANVKCYIVFKGGHEDKTKAINKEKRNNGRTFELNEPLVDDEIVLPVFMKVVYKEVLSKLGLNFVVCQFESKQQCIALAQKLKCPIISQDVEFCFSGVPYIPKSTMTFVENQDCIECGIFHYDLFRSKYNLTKEKAAVFIAILDEKTPSYSIDIFKKFFDYLKLPLSFKRRNSQLLKWLKTTQNPISKVSPFLGIEYRETFKEEVDKNINRICKDETVGIPAQYLLKGNEVTVTKNDPDWFEKGVALGTIAIQYVNMYYCDFVFGSWCIEDLSGDDACLLSFDIVAYAYNLLTNYQRDELLFFNINGETEHKNVSLTNPATIPKPSYVAQNNPFENGWDGIKDLQLFDHFMTHSLKGVNLEALDKLGEDARLLVLALVYFSRRKADAPTREVYSILLSYVMLGVVSDKVDARNNNVNLKKKPLLASITDKNLVTKEHCNIANSIMADFFELSDSELNTIFDRTLIHPFVEFKHCLQAINNLNKLCGSPYRSTMISKTYNGTLVYKCFYSMRAMTATKAMNYLQEKLSPAPTVLALFNGLIGVYDEVMST